MVDAGELEVTFVEEYEGGLEEMDKGRYKNATILLSKSLFAVCDLLIISKLGKYLKTIMRGLEY